MLMIGVTVVEMRLYNARGVWGYRQRFDGPFRLVFYIR
jgi:hypothetical protein